MADTGRSPDDIHGIGVPAHGANPGDVTGHPSPGGTFTPSAAGLPPRRWVPPGTLSDNEILASRLAAHPDVAIRRSTIAQALYEVELCGYDRGVRDATEAEEPRA